MSILLVPFTFNVFYFLSMIFLISCLCIIEPVQNLRVSLWPCKKVQVGKDQEKAQSKKDSHSKNRGGKKPN